MRIALGIEYDGSVFCGWQTQPAGCAVQDKLEAALSQIAGEPLVTVCAGRTDAGVHALDQVIHFDTDVKRPLTAWVRGANALLPGALSVTWAQVVAGDFHARYSALERCYRYVLLNHAVRPAVDRQRVGWCHIPLSVDAMRRGSSFLIGEHDFSAFRAAECQARSPVRKIRRIDVERIGHYVVFEFCANAFLHHMVRNIVGCLVYVGSGRHEPQWVADVLARRERALAAPTIDAAGLYLARVVYGEQWGLPRAPRAYLPQIALLTGTGQDR